MKARSPIRDLGRSWLRFWAPAGLLDIYRQRRHDRASRTAAPLQSEEARFLLPKRALEEIFPGIGCTEVNIEVLQFENRDQWMLPLQELLSLAGVCKYARPRRVFEIGTYTGSSTLVMALNTPPETEIFTLDLDAAQKETYKHEQESGGFPVPTYAVGSSYQRSELRKKIRQILGNSFTYDYSPFYGSIDLVFIDGEHAYPFVKRDTENALKLLRPGGIVIWDDYLYHEDYPTCGGVRRCADEFLKSEQAFQIGGTRFAIYLDTPLGRQHLNECSAPQGCV